MQTYADSALIEKWYKKLRFPSKYDDEFYEALQRIQIPTDISIETYDLKSTDGKKNLLSFLYMCEDVEKRYQEKGISEDILLDTLEDLVRWTEIWSDLKNELCLGQLTWVSLHMKMRIFKIGRLQFAMQKAGHALSRFDVSADDDIIGIHIPAAGPMTEEACRSSIDQARAFFERFYPSYHYEYFTCHSWLLDPTLEEILPQGSNILNFGKLFDIAYAEPSDALLGYVFQWMTNREEVKKMEPRTSLAKKVQERIFANGTFYEGYGVISK